MKTLICSDNTELALQLIGRAAQLGDARARLGAHAVEG